MTQESIKRNYSLAAQMMTLIVKDAFKLMARDETLSRFLIDSTEPAYIIDLQIMAQREALQLAEIALLELIDSRRWKEQLTASSKRIQERFQDSFGEKGAITYLAQDLLDQRFEWLDLRAQFFRQLLSLRVDAESPSQLLREAFRKREVYDEWLQKLYQSEKDLAQKILSVSPALIRFLLMKYFECERDAMLNTGREYGDEAFKTLAKLKGS